MNIRDMRPKEGKWSNNSRGLQDLVKTFPKGMKIFLEIGSWKGESSRVFSEYTEQMICVDFWSGLLPDADYTMEDVYEDFKRNVDTIQNLCWLRMPSLEAAKLFPDLSLSGIYVDASHKEKWFRKDLIAWIPKVMWGGIVAGHDFYMEGVKKSVLDIIGEPDMIFDDTSWLWKKRR